MDTSLHYISVVVSFTLGVANFHVTKILNHDDFDQCDDLIYLASFLSDFRIQIMRPLFFISYKNKSCICASLTP